MYEPSTNAANTATNSSSRPFKSFQRSPSVADLFDRLVFVRAARGDDFLKDLRDALDGGLNLLRRLLGQREAHRRHAEYGGHD
jgi:hypothetical protein